MNKRKKVLIWLSTSLAIPAAATGIYFASTSTKKLEKGGTSYDPNQVTPNNPIDILEENKPTKPEVNKKLISNVDIKFNHANPIKYLALGDSITEGYTGELENIIQGYYDPKTKEIVGNGYPSHFVNYLLKADKDILTSFSNYAVSGSTAQEWYSLLNLHNEANFIAASTKANKLEVKDLVPLFGTNISELSTVLIDKIKDANLITLSVGTNDFFKLFIREVSKNLDLTYIIENAKNQQELFKYLVNAITEIFNKVDVEAKKNIHSLSKTISHLNPRAQVIFLKYPMPMLRIKQAIDSILTSLSGSEAGDAPIELSRILFSAVNSRISQLFINLENRDEIKIINLYDNEFWTTHKNILSPVILDIHPGSKGYKKMAQDLFVALATEFTNLNHVRANNKYLANTQYFSELRSIPKMIDFKLSDADLISKVFDNNFEEDLNEINSLESKYNHLISNENNVKKIVKYVETYLLYSSKGQDYFIKNIYHVIEGILDSKIMKEIDPDAKIKEFLFVNDKKNLNSITKQFVDSNIIATLFANFQNSADTLDLDMNNVPGVQEFSLNILKEIAIKTFGDEKTWFDFIKVMLSGDYISEAANKEKIKEIVEILIENGLNAKRINQIVLLVKNLNLPSEITGVITKEDFNYLVEKILNNNALKTLVINALKNTIDKSNQIVAKANSFKELLKEVFIANKANAVSDVKNAIYSLINDEKALTIVGKIAAKSLEKYKDYVPAGLIDKWIAKLGLVIKSIDEKIGTIDVVLNNTFEYIINNGFEFGNFGPTLTKIKDELFGSLDRNKIAELVTFVLHENEGFFDENLGNIVSDAILVIKQDKVKTLISKELIKFLKMQKIVSESIDYAPLINDALDLMLTKELDIVVPIITRIYNEIKTNKLDLKTFTFKDIAAIALSIIKPKFDKTNLENTLQIILGSKLISEDSNLLKAFLKDVLANLNDDVYFEKLFEQLNANKKLQAYITQQQFVSLIKSIKNSNEFNRVIDFVFANLNEFKNVSYKVAINKILDTKSNEINEIIKSFVTSLVNNKTLKDIVLNAFEKELVKFGSDAEYVQAVQKLRLQLDADFVSIFENIDAANVASRIIVGLIGEKVNNTKTDYLAIFKDVYAANDLNDLVLKLIKKVSKFNLVAKNHIDLKIVIKNLAKYILSDKVKLKDVINVLAPNAQTKINKFVDFDKLLEIISSRYSDDLILLVDLVVDGMFDSLDQIDSVSTLNELLKLALQNINETKVKKLMVDIIQKMISDDEVLQSIAQKIKNILVKRNLLDDTPQMIVGIKSLIRIIPMIEQNGKYLEQFANILFNTIKANNDLSKFSEEIVAAIKAHKFIDINNISHITSILKTPQFVNEKQNIKAVFDSLFEHLWADEKVVKELISDLNLANLAANTNVITGPELESFIFNYVYKPVGQNSFKQFITNIINDIFKRSNEYANTKKAVDILKIFLANSNYETTNKEFIVKLISDLIDHTDVLPKVIFNKLKAAQINLLDEDLPVVVSVVKDLFSAVKNSNLFKEIVVRLYEEIKTFNYTNNINNDFKTIFGKVVDHFIKNENGKININKIVNEILPQVSSILEETKFSGSQLTQFINLLFTRSVFDKNKSQGIYKIINKIIYAKNDPSNVEYNAFDLLFKAPNNLKALVKAFIKPIARAHISEVINNQKAKNYNIYNDANFHAINRIATFFTWTLRVNVPGAVFHGVNGGWEINSIIYFSINDAFKEVLSEVDPISEANKDKYYLKNEAFVKRVFGDRYWLKNYNSYEKDDWMFIIKYYDQEDRHHPGMLNADNLWYLFKNGHLILQ
ncbi:SGNH/GDSL hydrolase family protein [Mycoplasmopsis equigenitalium]|uniref:SGNH/GDSL hydrolase family protein n=1 Tax=Mycoplasmopsis equigenitalium TaxID=114883 RepID=A0ABY5J1S2_9BACT|nr:SGNH/GDSL hydrolase family protein [Mycoplasmopsis equigenitalium]UUD36723.1 SGNH/GDSL hydrolase family protein [Mycoplasmopsis equigenitalium]